jgi:dipeptidyl aminopeptidase/acylaminoacyl peptidase
MRRGLSLCWLFVGLLIAAACAPTPTGNVLGYLVAERLGTLEAAPPDSPTGTLIGTVLANGAPLPGAAVIVAERTGRPYATTTDPQGRYRLERVPVGQYVPAAVAPGYEEGALAASFGIPVLVTVQAGAITNAPPLTLVRHRPPPLPTPLAQSVGLTLTHTAIVTAAFPAGATARVQAFHFAYAGALIDTLRLYLPPDLEPTTRLPVLFMVYPSHTDLWQSVSTAYAAQGYALVAISPSAARGTSVQAHAADARVALELARGGALSPQLDGGRIVALGGSFSSAILHRLIRDTGDAIAGWVTVGGISDAFAGTAEFYAGRLEIPPQYTYLIPALGAPNLYPLTFLRYSPVYTAGELPPTLIIHTGADRVIPIEQAYALEAALRQAGVPVETFYYEDVSHYLQIDEQMTEQGRAMFYRVLEFAERILNP